jgi:hypothetical protein
MLLHDGRDVISVNLWILLKKSDNGKHISKMFMLIAYADVGEI